MALTTKNERGESVPLLNLPNMLTIIRLVLVPVFVACYWADTPQRRWWALAVFVVAALTDKLDGYYARSRGLITDFGKLADSIADKALIIAALLLLSWHDMLWWWVTILFIVREVGITLMRMALKSRKVMAAGWWGKIKMFAQSIGIAVLLVPWETLLGNYYEGVSNAWSPAAHAAYIVGYVCIGIALFFAIISAYGYVKEGINVVRGIPAPAPASEERPS